jgi:hypothetical protein
VEGRAGTHAGEYGKPAEAAAAEVGRLVASDLDEDAAVQMGR